PAAGLLQLAAPLQDRPEVQRGPPVAACGSLPVPLLGLLGGSGAVAVAGLLPGPQVECAGQAVGGLAVPALGRRPHPSLGVRVPAVLQQVGEGVGAEDMALFGGLAQPVLGGGFVAAFAVVAAQCVGGGRRTGDRRDPPPSGGFVGVSALVEEDSQVVGGCPVPGG